MKSAVIDNPVTTVAAIGAVVGLIGHFVGWDAETQALVANGILATALLFRAAIAYAKAQLAKEQ